MFLVKMLWKKRMGNQIQEVEMKQFCLFFPGFCFLMDFGLSMFKFF